MSVRVIDTATPALQRLTDQFADKPKLHDLMARAGAKVIRENFVKMAQTEKNRFEAPSTFWKRMRGGVSSAFNAARGLVRMPYEVGLRFHGGTVRPTGGRKALTIPTSKTSYGKSARSFSDLVFVPRRVGKLLGLLGRPAGKGSFEVLYRLVSEATIKPKKEVLPSDEQFRTAIAGDLRQKLSQKGPR